MVVDPDGAETQVTREAQRPAHAPCPYRRTQTVGDAVGPFERLAFISGTLHADDGAKDLALNDLGVLRDAREHVGPTKKPLARGAATLTTSRAPRLRARATNPSTRSRCAAEMTGPISASARAGFPTRSSPTLARQGLEQFVVHAGRGDDAARREAVLAEVPVPGHGDRARDGSGIGVVEHDHGRLGERLAGRRVEHRLCRA